MIGIAEAADNRQRAHCYVHRRLALPLRGVHTAPWLGRQADDAGSFGENFGKNFGADAEDEN